MEQYHNVLKKILAHGTKKQAAREGMPGTISLFGHQERFDLSKGFPILTTKKMFWKGIVAELLWFLRGDTNIKFLDEHGVRKMWHEDAYQYYVSIAKNGLDSYNLFRKAGTEIQIMSFEDFCKTITEFESYSLPGANYFQDGKLKSFKLGDCGFQYGRVWRKWEKSPGETVDQIKNVINSLMTNPMGRRHIVTAIDPGHDQELALYWCHAMFQFNCRPLTAAEKGKRSDGAEYYLDLHMIQRSCDSFLGLPFNISSYSLLLLLVAKICNMVPGEYIHSFGDVHIYDNHTEAVDEILKRDYNKYQLPTVEFKDNIDWDYIKQTADFSRLLVEDLILKNYESYPKIDAVLSTGLKK